MHPANELPFQPSLNFKYPKGRDSSWKTGNTWLADKRNDDGAEGLWRVHNGLYELTDYVKKHPGGKMWLQLTKGTDITEAFECHHLTTKPENILKKYFVREAKTPRNSPFTFEDDGFYRTLKRRVAPLLKDIPKESTRISDITIDVLCLATFVFGILATATKSYFMGCISGTLLCFTTVAAHNYFHKRDNVRMYYFNFSFLDFREWRITHALSHHLYPNTIIDFEISFVEPSIVYLPQRKTFMVKYGSWLLIMVLWSNIFLLSLFKSIFQVVKFKETHHLHWANALPLLFPTAMYIFSGQSLSATITMWLFIIHCGSFLFGFIGFNAAHHHPEIFHDGDSPRSKDKYDWGLHQLDAVADRHDVTGSPFLVLTTFGDHALHHLFPTLDHGSLNYLYGVFQEVMFEFGAKLRIKSQLELIKGQFMQLSREIPRDRRP